MADHKMHLDDIHEAATPTTPRPPTSLMSTRQDDTATDLARNASNQVRPPSTPTGQRPLSDSSVARESSAPLSNDGIRRDNSQRSTQSNNTDEMDVDGSDEEHEDGSGDETEGGDPARPSKKKKGSILGSDLSNVIAIVDSLDLTIFDNMLRLYTSMKKSLAIRWLLLEQDFNDKFEPTVLDHLEERAQEQAEATPGIVEVTVATSQLQALDQQPQLLALPKNLPSAGRLRLLWRMKAAEFV
ncbi:MAG: hypothetical protein Q9227_006849 [Pyrenula ochraceoflavens]